MVRCIPQNWPRSIYPQNSQSATENPIHINNYNYKGSYHQSRVIINHRWLHPEIYCPSPLLIKFPTLSISQSVKKNWLTGYKYLCLHCRALCKPSNYWATEELEQSNDIWVWNAFRINNLQSNLVYPNIVVARQFVQICEFVQSNWVLVFPHLVYLCFSWALGMGIFVERTVLCVLYRYKCGYVCGMWSKH